VPDTGARVTTERVGHVLVTAIEREAKRNALNAEITAGVDAAMNELEDDPELWCGVLAGTAGVFSAGADLSAGTGQPTPRGGEVGLVRRQRVKPLIAAVEGYAVGGGMELVLACDLVVASTTATFGLPEVKRGLMADYGGPFRVMRALPPNVAREMLLTGDWLDAERAERLGFVNVLTEPGGARAAAVALAERICANAPLAVQASLGVANQVFSAGEDDAWASSDRRHLALVDTDDCKEGIDAFFARRPPEWKNR
jgi:enoyl-CoA hydratase/carnithine racemase